VKVRWWKILHWVIIINALVGIIYGTYMVFFVIGGGYPLFQRAREIPTEVLLQRRLFAIETWVAVGGLSVYLAITEILPRKLSQFKGGAS